MYDFITGRWVSEDPDGYRPGEWNLFRYCGNDPINNIDPSGNEPQPTQPFSGVEPPKGEGNAFQKWQKDWGGNPNYPGQLSGWKNPD